MTIQIQALSAAARRAAEAKDWNKVHSCARDILNRQRDSAEGRFLLGLVEKAARRTEQAISAFSLSFKRDAKRYDAAVELAGQYMLVHRYGEAVALLEQVEPLMKNSPRYLTMAGTIYMNAGLPDRALPLYRAAIDLQPAADSVRAKLAACNVFAGNIQEAKVIYRELLERFPNHQQNHYELAKLERAEDDTHIEQMKAVLTATNLPPAKNIYLYYAIGKEAEDLGHWDNAFRYYKMAGDAAAAVANYDVGADIRLIDKVIEVCNDGWLREHMAEPPPEGPARTPIFIVGLPRSGTTLTERILSSHSKVESIGESFFMQIVIKHTSRVRSQDAMNPDMIEAAAGRDMAALRDGYLAAIDYRLGSKPFFIEKFPENILYLGFISIAFPNARIIVQKRNPLDTCFAMYKQSFFRYAYTLEDLGPYYVAYDRLYKHWRRLLADRLIEVEYETMVQDQVGQTRLLLERLGLGFEEACIDFEKNRAASNTASAVQIREKVHTRSVKKWVHFEKHLQPLIRHLEQSGIKLA